MNDRSLVLSLEAVLREVFSYIYLVKIPIQHKNRKYGMAEFGIKPKFAWKLNSSKSTFRIVFVCLMLSIVRL